MHWTDESRGRDVANVYASKIRQCDGERERERLVEGRENYSRREINKDEQQRILVKVPFTA